MEEHLTELIIDFLISRAISVQMFFHYFIIYFCIYLLHEDPKVGKLALVHSIFWLGVQVMSSSPDYFFFEAIAHEILLIQATLLIVSGNRAIMLVGLGCLSIVINVLLCEFPRELIYLYSNYTTINRVLLETTMAILLYDHKSKRRNFILILVMLLLYTHEIQQTN